MAGVNKVILVGRLGKDPEVRNLENGATVANFTIATSETYKDKTTGDKKEITEWPFLCRAPFMVGNPPFESKLVYNPQMQGTPWSMIALGPLLLISACLKGGQEVQSPQPEKSNPPLKTEQRGRILGIGGVFFKSADRDQMREWYSKHLGLADKGQGVMLPWREHDDPQKEHVTVWTVFPTSTDYIPATQPFMVNYIVDDMEALLDRLKQEGVKIVAKQMNESYGRFAWIYDSDGNKIELWQPLPAKP